MTSRLRQALGAVEARSIDYVPASERRGRVSDQGRFWFLGNFCFVTVAVGFVGPSLHLSLTWTALAGALGILFGTIFQAFHASQGAELGLPQMIQSRAQFGYRGVIVPLVGALLTYVGFNVVDAILVAQGLHGAWGMDFDVVVTLMTLAATGLAIWGHDWLHRAYKILFWVNLPLFILLTGAVLGGHVARLPVGVHAPAAFALPAFLTQFAAAASYNITYAPYVSDYSRYLPKTTSRVAIIAQVFAGSASSAIWLIWLGAWLATRMGATDGLGALMRAGDLIFHGFGAVLAVVSALTLMAAMAVNAYSGMLTAVTGLDSIEPVRPTRTLRIVTILALTAAWWTISISLSGNPIDVLGALLVILLYLLAPWTAVNLVDFFLLRRGRYAVLDLATPTGVYGAWGVRGLAGYFAGLAASIPFFLIPGVWIGPFARALGGVDLAWLVSLVISALAYLIASRGFSIEREAPAIAASQAALAAIDARSG